MDPEYRKGTTKWVAPENRGDGVRLVVPESTQVVGLGGWLQRPEVSGSGGWLQRVEMSGPDGWLQSMERMQPNR